MKKLIVTNLILLCLLVNAYSQSIPSYVPSNGLVAWWPFNGNANDQSGNGYDGVLGGTTPPTLINDRFGNPNCAYSFTGVNATFSSSGSHIILPSFSNNLWQAYTISIWVNEASVYNQCSSCGIESYINFGTQPVNGANGTKIYRTGNYVGYIVQDSGYFYQDNLSFRNIWKLYTLTYDGSQMKSYIDGVLMSSKYCSAPLNVGSNYNSIARSYWNNGGSTSTRFNGKIDDVGIWNRALTQQEITALYTAQACTGTGAITADGPTTFCAGNSVNLTSDVVGGTYQWKKNGVNISTNGTSRTYKATATGSYTCVATCNGAALTSNAIAVTSKTNASATVTASGATSFCAGDSVTLNATNLGSNYSVQWYRTNVSIENATTYSQVVKQPGTYKVVTKNLANGCSRISGSSAVVAVSCRLANPDVITNDLISTDFDAKVAGGDAKGKIYIYPNPTSDNKFTVELLGLEVDGNATLEVYNAMGQLLYSEKVNITNGSLNRTIQIDEQSRGQLCLVRLMVGSEVYDSKVILK
jgi:Concanavalin A-like lectin/glucanases superfamily